MRSLVRFPCLVVPLFSFRPLLRLHRSLFLFSFRAGCPKVFLLFRPHPWRLGVVFPFELVAPRTCCCFLGFSPPREAGAASMLPRAPAGVGQRFRSDVGPYVNRHRQYGSANEGRCCAKASALFSWKGGGERTLVIYVKERHRRYKVDQLIVNA